MVDGKTIISKNEAIDLLNEQEETIERLKHELLCKQLDKAPKEPVNCKCYMEDLE
jgi:hypothetical protein